MKFTATPVKAGIGAVGIATISVFTAATAAAAPTIQKFGTSEKLVDNGGAVVTDYTVNGLQPSNVVIPGYTPHGKIWQANVNVAANRGIVTPVIADFNARAADGQTYRVIDSVPTPGGVNPGPIDQGGHANGKIYFDVTGAPPDGVVYNNGVEDLLIWTNKA